MNTTPIHCGLCQSAPCECPGHDDSIPIETRRELMHCAVSNGRISYYYLCDVWKRGRRSKQAESDSASHLHDELLAALRAIVGVLPENWGDAVLDGFLLPVHIEAEDVARARAVLARADAGQKAQR